MLKFNQIFNFLKDERHWCVAKHDKFKQMQSIDQLGTFSGLSFLKKNCENLLSILTYNYTKVKNEIFFEK